MGEEADKYAPGGELESSPQAEPPRNDQPMMECGHIANATSGGAPACVICVGIHPGATVIAREQPDLSARQARCTCGQLQPSSPSLAFFEFRGDGSPMARDSCGNCGFFEVAHTRADKRATVCDNFVPRGAMEFDAYYCGHAGWD